uniref:BPI fold-containing family B member 1 n=1 Tax=Ictidomys tridecemlineatus TaxID=43179 RepID=UPI001A9DEC57|nr:BPI fold-containing family B member 1 [Ictidomys tridecemlineatus]
MESAPPGHSQDNRQTPDGAEAPPMPWDTDASIVSTCGRPNCPSGASGPPASHAKCPGQGPRQSLGSEWPTPRRLTPPGLTQKLKHHEATTILQQLPLLSAMQEESSRGLLSGLMDTVMKHVVWLKVTSAAITQLQIQPSDQDQELVIKIPLDMVAGFNTPLVKTIVDMHIQSEVEARIRVDSEQVGPSALVLSDCFNRQGSLHISLLHKISFWVSPLADKVTSLLMPALPKLVKTQLCPVIQAAFKDMFQDFLKLVKVPIPLSPGGLLFDLLSSNIKGNVIQLNLQVSVREPQRVLGQLPPSSGVQPTALASSRPQLPDLAKELKSSIKEISEQAAEMLDRTQLVKFQTRKTPQLLLSQDGAQAVQLIVLDLFPTNKAQRPLFTLGIEAKSEAQFYTEGDQLVLSFNDISIERMQLMNSDIKLFNVSIHSRPHGHRGSHQNGPFCKETLPRTSFR